MATVRRAFAIVLAVILALVLFSGGWLIGRLGIGAAVDEVGGHMWGRIEKTARPANAR